MHTMETTILLRLIPVCLEGNGVVDKILLLCYYISLQYNDFKLFYWTFMIFMLPWKIYRGSIVYRLSVVKAWSSGCHLTYPYLNQRNQDILYKIQTYINILSNPTNRYIIWYYNIMNVSSLPESVANELPICPLAITKTMVYTNWNCVISSRILLCFDSF